jgi:hypothetical protein
MLHPEILWLQNRPPRYPDQMTKRRALYILKLLGWTQVEACRRFNAATTSNYTRGGFGNLLRTPNGVSKPLALFLRMSVRVRQLERRIARLEGRVRRA